MRFSHHLLQLCFPGPSLPFSHPCQNLFFHTPQHGAMGLASNPFLVKISGLEAARRIEDRMTTRRVTIPLFKPPSIHPGLVST
ncbi:hypothetical protein BS50DRAFT_324018 [Corynespora cassiicola Philippines]|uniref:Uncharacterized protein n=1 Tax=Corynespora cassiicola Philippines TaxID=1448308 RepID=A0A2T2NTP6_CORCC|nr:hypothetical protein BS50DRAFT_324018 [Corynespora cassiicola Philippines]